MSKDFNEAVDVLFHKVDDLVQKEIALGSLLGDAYLRPSKGKTSYTLSFTHAAQGVPSLL